MHNNLVNYTNQMKKNILLLFLFSTISFAQVSISQEKYNALKEITAIPRGMNYEEFIKVQREVNWKKIAVASVLPGFIHLYAKHYTEAYIIMGVRLIGGALMGIALVDQYKLQNDIDYSVIIDSDEESDRTERNTILFSTGLILNVMGFAFDWAHGDWVIETERNEIYFKYGLDSKRRKALGISYNTQFNYPSITFSYRF
jgi:hypothetical protein